MKSKLLFIVISFALLINVFGFSNSGDVLTDPKEIIIKPKAVNGLLMFTVKYWSSDFKLLVKKAIHEGFVDQKLLRDNSVNENNVIEKLNMFEALGYNYDWTGVIYTELIIATVKNLESKQEFRVVLHPIIKRAFIPNITIGKYKFEKLTLMLSLGVKWDTYKCDIMLHDELPEFTINSNTAFLYGQISLRKGEIKQVNDKKSMEKLRKYIDLIKKFKRYENLKVIELNSQDTSIK